METKTKAPAVAMDVVANLKNIAARKGNRLAAFALINGECHRQTFALAGMPLDLADLPDLPCVMYAADEIESIFETHGIHPHTISDARQVAADAVAELLAEEGFDLESDGGE